MKGAGSKNAGLADRTNGTDGTNRFKWTGRELLAHHAVFGDIKVPAAAVCELIYRPTPCPPSTVAPLKKTAQNAPPQILPR